MEYFDIRSILPEIDREKNELGAEFFDDLAMQMDGRIPKDIAEMLLAENNNPDYELRIHRCLADKKDGIFNNGLEIKSGNKLDYTTSEYDSSDISLLLEVDRAHGYKNPIGADALCVLIKIPKDYLTYEKGKTKPILIPTEHAAEESGGMMVLQNEFQTILKPEFILGAIHFSKGEITGYESNENYRDVHDYDCTGLRCVRSVIEDYYDKTGVKRVYMDSFDDDKQRKQDEEVNSIIVNEQVELMNGKNSESLIRAEEINVDPEIEEVSATTGRTADDLKKVFLGKMPKSRFMEAAKRLGNIFNRDDNINTKENTGEEK